MPRAEACPGHLGQFALEAHLRHIEKLQPFLHHEAGPSDATRRAFAQMDVGPVGSVVQATALAGAMTVVSRGTNQEWPRSEPFSAGWLSLRCEGSDIPGALTGCGFSSLPGVAPRHLRLPSAHAAAILTSDSLGAVSALVEWPPFHGLMDWKRVLPACLSYRTEWMRGILSGNLAKQRHQLEEACLPSIASA